MCKTMNSKALAAQKMVVNARFDQQNFRLQQNEPHSHARDSEMYDIKEHEILVCNKRQRSTDGISRVQSAHDGKNGQIDESWHEQWRFFGVSDTEHRADLTYRMDQGLAVVVGGIAKAYNESGHPIGAGAYLTIKPSEKSKARGIPSHKKRYTFVEFDPDDAAHKAVGIVAKALNNSRAHGSMDILIMPSVVTQA